MPSRLSARSRGCTGKWDLAAAECKRIHPLCLGCYAIGRSEPTILVDHIEPHRGNSALFWSRSNWQPCCEWHHNTLKKTLEARWDRCEIAKTDLRRQRSGGGGDAKDPAAA